MFFWLTLGAAAMFQNSNIVAPLWIRIIAGAVGLYIWITNLEFGGTTLEKCLFDELPELLKP
ncbi:MAG: hypothetical protein KDN19_20175, partial [Verrucomicrobiae bacterium]|nr:hypothetical protein [Verrucomicrobiae bacterium]